jgi:polyferredoxin
MVALVKTAKTLAGVEPGLYAWGAALLAFVLLAVIGNKAACGWICPYGALQELLFKIPLAARLKQKIKIPFAASNTIRCILFILFAAGLATNLFHLKAQGRALYHWVNPFNLFDLNFASASVTAYIAATLLAAVFFYRPHCYFVCPFGLLSWALEKLSLFKIRIHPQKCTGCGACIKACPGRAMEGIYKGSALPADCFSCGECLHACQFDALSYSLQAPPAAQR